MYIYIYIYILYIHIYTVSDDNSHGLIHSVGNINLLPFDTQPIQSEFVPVSSILPCDPLCQRWRVEAAPRDTAPTVLYASRSDMTVGWEAVHDSCCSRHEIGSKILALLLLYNIVSPPDLLHFIFPFSFILWKVDDFVSSYAWPFQPIKGT